jgi:hypothetical protein
MELGYQKLPEISTHHNTHKFYTSDEISFINHLRLTNPTTCRKYCELIISGMRCYDRTVDIMRVVSFAEGALKEMDGIGHSAVLPCQ